MAKEGEQKDTMGSYDYVARRLKQLAAEKEKKEKKSDK